MRRITKHGVRLAAAMTATSAVAILGWQLLSADPAPATSPDRAIAAPHGAPQARRGGPATVAGSPASRDAATLATSSVGALFTLSGGQLGSHFCTASVIHSPTRDLLVTAAHCLAGYPAAPLGEIAFVPAYDGAAPLGIWNVTRIFVDAGWAASANPDDDVAFLTVARSSGGTRVEDVTGAADLGAGQPAAGTVSVVGYPDSQDQPILCKNNVRPFSPSQIEFDCDNFTNGTSGSPLLAAASPATGTVTVIGVIGGYQQGGVNPDVSYAASFGQNIQALYRTAVAAG